MKARDAIVLLALAAGLVGCAREPSHPDITYRLSDPADLCRLDRVVIAQLQAVDTSDQYARQVSIELSNALQSRRLFHVDLMEESEALYKDLPLRTAEGLSIAEMSEIRKALDCDGIILGQVRNFRSYPHMQVGLFVKLIDLRRGKLVWAVDHVWDTARKDTAGRIRQYFCSTIRKGYEPVNWQVAMMSPKMFAKFVTYEVAATLPMGREPCRTEK